MSSKVTCRNLSFALAALLACALVAAAQQPAAPAPAGGDEAAMRENVRQMEAGWNTKSGALFAKPFAEDADYVVINGIHIKGREAIDRSHQGIFETIFKDSTLSLSVKQVRLLRPDVALVHVTGHHKTRRGEETHESDAIVTLLMTKEKGVWRIAAFQNTEVTAGRR